MSRGQVYLLITITMLLTFAYLLALSVGGDVIREERWPLQENIILCNKTETAHLINNGYSTNDFYQYLQNWKKEMLG